MAQSFNVKNFFSTNTATVATSSTSFVNKLAINSDADISLQTANVAKMDDSDLDTDQIRRRGPSDFNRNNYASTDDILHEATTSTTQLTETSSSGFFKENSFLKSKSKVITVAILFTLNLVNYMDRFTVAGN